LLTRKGPAAGRILIDSTELKVSEDVDGILEHIVRSKDGVRLGSGVVIAPAGWVALTAPGTGDPIYVQVARTGYVRKD
jgi:hypothetical protein